MTRFTNDKRHDAGDIAQGGTEGRDMTRMKAPDCRQFQQSSSYSCTAGSYERNRRGGDADRVGERQRWRIEEEPQIFGCANHTGLSEPLAAPTANKGAQGGSL